MMATDAMLTLTLEQPSAVVTQMLNVMTAEQNTRSKISRKSDFF